METIEFEAELRGGRTLALPPEVVKRLPKTGRARIIMVVPDDREDRQWRQAAYEQFMKDDADDDGSAEDAVYDTYE